MERYANMTRSQIATAGPAHQWDSALPEQREKWLHDSGIDLDLSTTLWTELPETHRLTLRQQVMGERGHMPLSRLDAGRDQSQHQGATL